LCNHRTTGRWGRAWDAWLIGAAGSFAVLETSAVATGSSPLTAYLRQLAGLEPRCRHHHLGRTVILVALGWTAAHLGWGVLGWKPW
jgi:hypothetical protein